MPVAQGAMLEALLLEGAPNCPADRRALAVTLALPADVVAAVERYLGATAEPAVRFVFGADDSEKALREQVAAAEKRLNEAQAEVARYRAAYDKNPPESAGRASLLEVD